MSNFSQRIDKVYEIVTLPEDTKIEILAKFAILADEFVKGTDSKLIMDNLDCYNAICKREIMYMLRYDKQASYYIKAATNHPKLNSILGSAANIEQTISKITGIINTSSDNLSKDNIILGLNSFGVKVADDINDGDDILETGQEDEIDWENLNINIEDQVKDDILPNIDDIPLDEEEEEEEEEELELYDDITEDTDNTKKVEDDSTKDKEVENSIVISEQFKANWKDKANSIVSIIMSSYDALYKSGYTLMIPEGVLTNQGILKSDSRSSQHGQHQLVFGGSRVLDIELYNAITSSLGQSNTFEMYSDSEPDIKELMNSNSPITYTRWHVRNTFGHYNYCGSTLKNHVADKYNSNRQNKDDYSSLPSTVKVTKYDDIRGWIRKNLENCIYESYIKRGITEEITPDAIESATIVNNKLLNSLKNVIVVAERKENVSTRIRICSNTAIDADNFVKALYNKLNVGTSSSIQVKQVGKYDHGVLELDIIYNQRVHSQSSLFAYEVKDILKEQGIRPSWNNVVLGKTDDGTIMTYNFKNKKSPTYALYAASRSGKGVMTLNLIASALADGCKLVYIDGKPDMACTLGDVAWSKGLDACVFNGVAGKGSETLEGRAGCVRDKELPFASKDRLLNDIFLTAEEKRKFILITTYLRGIDLLCKMAAYRASIADSLDKNDWLVAVADECEQAAIAESDVNDILDRAETARKGAKDANGKKIDLLKDPAYQFIQQYRNWVTLIVSNFGTCVASTFGFANMTTFFVWQSTKFPEKYKAVSSLAKVVDKASGNIVKIVGRGAAVNYGSTAFGTPSSLAKEAKWYDDRFSGEQGGFFAIGGDVNSNTMKVFRPFNVYSDAKHKDLILENAATMGLTEQDLVGTQLNEDGSVKEEVGFEGYVNSLLSDYGLNAAQQLNIGFNYANEIVKKLGLADNLLAYMYNCHDFKLKDTEMAEIDATNSEGGPDGYSPGTFTQGVNLDNVRSEDVQPPLNDQNQGAFDSRNNTPDTQEFINENNLGDLGDYAGMGQKVHFDGVPVPPIKPITSTNNFFIDEDEDDDDIEFGIEDDYIELEDPNTGEEYTEDEYAEDEIIPDEIIEDEIIEDIDYRQLYGNAFFKAEEMPIRGESTAFEFGKTGRQRRINPEPTSHAWELTDNNCIRVVMPTYDTSERFSNRFFRTIKGAEYEFNRRWKVVLKSITARVRSKDLITRVAIGEDTMYINKKLVSFDGVLGGFEDIRLKDIVNFKMLGKEFKNISELTLDTEIYTQGTLEAESGNFIGYLFGMMPKLQKIVILPHLNGATDGLAFSRASYNSVEAQRAASRLENENKFSQQMKAMAASKDNRFSQRSPGEQRTSFRATGLFPEDIRQAASSQFRMSSRSFLGGTAHSLGNIAAIAIGGIFGTVAGAWSWLNKRG